jgi:hypothetical protein
MAGKNGNGKPKPTGWGDDDTKAAVLEEKKSQPVEDRVSALEAEHEELLEILERHGINLPSRRV